MYWFALILSAVGAFALARFVIKPRVDAWRRRRALPARFVAVELQAAGPSPGKHEVVGIAALQVTPGSTDQPSMHALIRSGKPAPRARSGAARGSGRSSASGRASATGRASEGEAGSAAEAVRAFAEFAGRDRLVFFDAPRQQAFLNTLALQHGVRFGNPVSDVQDMARRAWPARASHKLGDLARSVGMQAPRRNSPLNDCGMIAAVYVEAAIKLKRFD